VAQRSKSKDRVSSGGDQEIVASERLLEAAVEAFGDRGYHATTTRQIAERAGMSPAGMYIHFQSKQDILYQVTRRGHASVLAAVEEALAAEAPPEVQVRRFVEAFTTWHAWNHRAARIQQYELHALASEHYDDIRNVRSRFGHMLKQELRRGMQSGTFTIPYLDTTALAILSLGIDVARWYRPGVDPAPEDLGKRYGDLVLAMLGAPPQ
jgi:AcrR family transcriptional regulator